MVTYRIAGLDPGPYEHFFAMDEAQLTAAGAAIVFSDADTGYPCRVTLSDAPAGTRLLLVNHSSVDAGPYAARHAIFVSQGARKAEYVDAIPPALESRILSLRAFGTDSLMVDALLVDAGEADAAIRKLLGNPQVDHLDAHNAQRGCFAARVERA